MRLADGRPGWRLVLRVALCVVISAGILWMLLRAADLDAVARAAAEADGRALALAAAAATVIVLFRCRRLAALMGRPLDRPAAMTFLVYNVAVSVLPAKLGELTLPLLLKRRHGASLWHGGGMVLVLRAYDLLCVGFLAGASLMVLAASGEPVAPWLTAGAVALAVVCLGLAVALPAVCRRAVALLHRLLPIPPRAAAILDGLAHALVSLRGARLRQHVLDTIGIWAAFAVTWTSVTAAFGDAAPAALAVLAGCLASLAFALPINGVANLGPVQVVWVWTMTSFGVPMPFALVTALAAHAVPLFISVLAGTAALVALAFEGGVAGRGRPLPAPPHTGTNPGGD